jgi:hypothetical protein
MAIKSVCKILTHITKPKKQDENEAIKIAHEMPSTPLLIK